MANVKKLPYGLTSLLAVICSFASLGKWYWRIRISPKKEIALIRRSTDNNLINILGY